MQEAGLSSLARVDSHRPTKVVQEVTSCSVDDAQSFNCRSSKRYRTSMLVYYSTPACETWQALPDELV